MPGSAFSCAGVAVLMSTSAADAVAALGVGLAAVWAKQRVVATAMVATARRRRKAFMEEGSWRVVGAGCPAYTETRGGSARPRESDILAQSPLCLTRRWSNNAWTADDGRGGSVRRKHGGCTWTNWRR